MFAIDNDDEPRSRQPRRQKAKESPEFIQATNFVAKAIDPGAWQSVSDHKAPITKRKETARRIAARAIRAMIAGHINLAELAHQNGTS